MNAITFDTLKLAQSLRDRAKFSPEQAEQTAVVLAETFGDWQEQQELATKSDVIAVKIDLAAVRADLEKTIAEVRADLIKWVIGMSFAQVAMLTAIMKLH